MMNNVQLLLFVLMSTFQTVQIKCVTKFKMKSCVRTRKVTFVIGTTSDRVGITENAISYFRQLKSYVEKYNNAHPCFTISLTYINPDNIFKMTGPNYGEALFQRSFIFHEEKIDYSKFFDFLNQYEKEIDGSQDNLLIFFASNHSIEVTERLKELRKHTPVFVVSSHNYLQMVLYYPEVGASMELAPISQFPQQHRLYFPKKDIMTAFENFDTKDPYTPVYDYKYEYKDLVPILELIQNPEFDWFKFIGETLYKRNVSCLRNTTVVWPIANRFFDEKPDYTFEVALLYEYFLAFTSKMNLEFCTVIKSIDQNHNKEIRYVKNISLIIYEDELYRAIPNRDHNFTVLSGLSYCKDKNDRNIVYIVDEYSKRLFPGLFRALSAQNKNCFVELKGLSDYRGGDPYRKQNVIYYSNKDSNPYGNVDLLFDALLDIGC